MSFKKQLYLDGTSTTEINEEVLKTYNQVLNKYYANSGALHKLGREVYRLQEKSRNEIINLLNVKNYNLIFTSGATEANNIAIKSLALAYQSEGKHLITTKIEHPSVYNSFKFLEEYLGFEVTYLNVDTSGNIDLNELRSELRADTILVSIMNVNNEVGSIINTNDWTSIVKKHSRAFTHSDMVQALGNIPLDFNNLDLASFSSHKINGLKGSGFLLIRDHIKLVPLFSGGDQEKNLRAGTENAPANIVLAKTVRIALDNQNNKMLKLKQLSEYFYECIKDNTNININSLSNNSVSSIINISIKGVGSEIMLNALSSKGIYISAGSTCQSDLAKKSRVLSALNISEKAQATRIRISLNDKLDKSDIDYLVQTIKEINENYAI